MPMLTSRRIASCRVELEFEHDFGRTCRYRTHRRRVRSHAAAADTDHVEDTVDVGLETDGHSALVGADDVLDLAVRPGLPVLEKQRARAQRSDRREVVAHVQQRRPFGGQARIRRSARSLNSASPTASTSSTISTSGTQAVVVAKVRRAFMPDE